MWYLVLETKEELKDKLSNSLKYILADSPLKKYHEKKYKENITKFNRILAREMK